MRDLWFQALMLTPPRMCGRRLLPYSMGHEYVLRRIGNPLVVGGTPTRADLLTAILVCSRTLDGNRRTLRPTPWDALRLRIWSLRWSRRMRFLTALENFRQYVREFSEGPEHEVPEQDGHDARRAAAPIPYHIVRVLCSVYNCRLDEAWDMPLGLALAYWDAWRESQGDETLLSETKLLVAELIEEGQALLTQGKDAEAKAKFAEAQAIANRDRKPGG